MNLVGTRRSFVLEAVERSWAAALLVVLVRAYQMVVAPLLGPHCRFAPSCSQFALEALCVHGALRGLRLTLGRLVRCHPLCEGGIDPVPPVHPSGR